MASDPKSLSIALASQRLNKRKPGAEAPTASPQRPAVKEVAKAPAGSIADAIMKKRQKMAEGGEVDEAPESILDMRDSDLDEPSALDQDDSAAMDGMDEIQGIIGKIRARMKAKQG